MKLRDMPDNFRFKGIRVQTTESIRGYWGEQQGTLLALHQSPDLADNPRMIPINDNTLEWDVLASNYKLFLDAHLLPKDCYRFMIRMLGIDAAKPYNLKGWVVARSMDQFKTIVEANGLPAFVSFGHDLTEEHDAVVKQPFANNYDSFTDTGYDCAVWLQAYCQVNNLDFPKWAVHENSGVRQRIIFYINQINNSETYRIFYGEKTKTGQP